MCCSQTTMTSISYLSGINFGARFQYFESFSECIMKFNDHIIFKSQSARQGRPKQGVRFYPVNVSHPSTICLCHTLKKKKKIKLATTGYVLATVGSEISGARVSNVNCIFIYSHISPAGIETNDAPEGLGWALCALSLILLSAGWPREKTILSTSLLTRNEYILAYICVGSKAPKASGTFQRVSRKFFFGGDKIIQIQKSQVR